MKHRIPGQPSRTVTPAAETNPRNSARKSQAAVISLRRAPAPAVQAAIPIQRTVTQILPGSDDKIRELHIVGRPERLFSNSLGDHTTAFATHVAAVKLHMEGKPLQEAYRGLLWLYTTARGLPGYTLKDNLPSDPFYLLEGAHEHGDRLREAEEQLQEQMRAAVGLFNGDAVALALKLQECVNAYLEFRELIPLSGINVLAVTPAKAGKGKGESKHAKVLADHQKGNKADQEALQKAIWGAFDTNAAALVVASTDPFELATLAPGLPFDASMEQRAGWLAAQHIASIKAGFPDAYGDSGFQDKELTARILQEAAKEMAIQRASFVLEAKKAAEQYSTTALSIASGRKELDIAYAREALDPLDRQRNFFFGRILAIDHRQHTEKKEEELVDALVKELAPPEEEQQERGVRTRKRRASSAAENKKEEKEKISERELKKRKKGKKKEKEDVPEDETEKAKVREEKKQWKEERKSPIATQIILSPDSNRIADLKIAGRPPSPLPGTMGAHTSAWILHVDRVKQLLTDKTVVEAWLLVSQVLVPEAQHLLKTLAKADPPTKDHKEGALEEAAGPLLAHAEINPQAITPPAARAFQLQLYINEFFTYVNQIPGVTRAAVNTDGRGEGRHRAVLNTFEKDLSTGDREIDQGEHAMIDKAIHGLLDIKKLAHEEVYKAAHYELISKVYPKTYAAYTGF